MSSLTTKALSEVAVLGGLTTTDHILVSPAASPNTLSKTTLTDFMDMLVPLFAVSANDLSDVDTSTTPPTTGQVLRWNSANWVPYTLPAAGVSALTALSDTAISSPTNGQALAYNSGTSKWTNQSLTIVGSSLFTTLPQFIGVRARLAADDTAADYTTSTAIDFDAEDFDTDAFHSNVTNPSRLSVVSGLNIEKVDVFAEVGLDLISVNTTVRLELKKNGTTIATRTTNLGNVTSGGISIEARGVPVTPGTDFFQVFMRVTGSSTVTVVDDQTTFSLQVVGATATSAEATTAQYLANTADKVLTTDQVWAAAAYVALTDASTIALDMSTFINATVTLGGNRTLGNPSNTKNGQTGVIEIKQDGTGTRTLAYSSNWKFAGGGTDPTLTTTAGARDLLFYQVISSTVIYGTLVTDVQ